METRNINTSDLTAISSALIERKRKAEHLFNQGDLSASEMRSYIIGTHSINPLSKEFSDKLKTALDNIPETALRHFSSKENTDSQRSICNEKITLKK